MALPGLNRCDYVDEVCRDMPDLGRTLADPAGFAAIEAPLTCCQCGRPVKVTHRYVLPFMAGMVARWITDAVHLDD